MGDADERLRMDLTHWTEKGRNIGEQTIARMALKPGERVLDLGCGEGWATRLLAQAVEGGPGMAVGLDISDEMIARARTASRDAENVLFTVGSGEEIPWRDEYFDKALSIANFGYHLDQEAVLRELYRVLIPGGLVFILINLCPERPNSLCPVNELKAPLHVRSASAYQLMLREQGFVDLEIVHIPDLTETPDRDELREFGWSSLLLVAQKPEARLIG
jgi:ubiquinone/menaquinone biosynthesis C-methylase UbiE